MGTPTTIRIIGLMAGMVACASGHAGAAMFSFGPGQVPSGYAQVLPETRYSAAQGYGFEEGPAVTAVDRGGPDR